MLHIELNRSQPHGNMAHKLYGVYGFHPHVSLALRIELMQSYTKPFKTLNSRQHGLQELLEDLVYIISFQPKQTSFLINTVISFFGGNHIRGLLAFCYGPSAADCCLKAAPPKNDEVLLSSFLFLMDQADSCGYACEAMSLIPSSGSMYLSTKTRPMNPVHSLHASSPARRSKQLHRWKRPLIIQHPTEQSGTAA